jgi:4a-hydroxytetrahydrobiopterin dehydratase
LPAPFKHMDKLYKKKCVACDSSSLPFDTNEINKYLKKIDGWDVKSDSDKNYYLEKEFKFKNFIASLEFVNKVGSIAELEGHHPNIYFGWGYTRIKIFTHEIKGLTESDFILAAKIDQI